MRVEFRTVAISSAVAIAIAGGLASPVLFPQAFADEPQHQLVRTAKDIFPPPFDPSKLRKFDIEIADTVSTEPLRTQYVRKIAGGRVSAVSIVTTSSGTYSSDGIASPHVLYPGIDVSTKLDGYGDGPRIHVATGTTPRGTFSWTVISSGSFTYYNSTFTPNGRHH
jgi:hypothetical protein